MSALSIYSVMITSSEQLGYNDAIHGFDFKNPGFSDTEDQNYLFGFRAGEASILEFGTLEDDDEYLFSECVL